MTSKSQRQYTVECEDYTCQASFVWYAPYGLSDREYDNAAFAHGWTMRNNGWFCPEHSFQPATDGLKVRRDALGFATMATEGFTVEEVLDVAKKLEAYLLGESYPRYEEVPDEELFPILRNVFQSEMAAFLEALGARGLQVVRVKRAQG